MKYEQNLIMELDGEVAIMRNQLSAFASELANKRIFVANLNRELENKMERRIAAEQKYKATLSRLEKEKSAQENLESNNADAEKEFKQAETMMLSLIHI